jgi:hypothetical protein
VLINCAGFFPTESFDDMALADWNFVIRALDAFRAGYLCLLEPNAKDAERGVQIGNVKH